MIYGKYRLKQNEITTSEYFIAVVYRHLYSNASSKNYGGKCMSYSIKNSVFIVCIFMSSLGLALEKLPHKPEIQLASRYQTNIVINDYLVSEKLDGVRARWNGRHLVTRGGHVISAPSWFTDGFSKQALDGELWITRNRFDEVSAIVRSKIADKIKWKSVTFQVFDLPMSSKIFAERYEQLQQIVNESTSPFLFYIAQKKLTNKRQLHQWLDDVEAQGGEGLMLHHKQARYEHKRSKKLLKLKKVYDAEARVVGHIEGRGKYQGMLGAMLMETDSGIRFKLGSGLSDELRQNPPPIGSLVTYQYYGITKKGKPRFASFLRVRTRRP